MIIGSIGSGVSTTFYVYRIRHGHDGIIIHCGDLFDDKLDDTSTCILWRLIDSIVGGQPRSTCIIISRLDFFLDENSPLLLLGYDVGQLLLFAVGCIKLGVKKRNLVVQFLLPLGNLAKFILQYF